MNDIHIAKPIQCHLAYEKPLTRDGLENSLESVKIYVEEAHLIKKLLKCKNCGQFYYYEFYEEIDWINNNNTKYYKYIPVSDLESADKLSELTMIELDYCLSICIDVSSNEKEPIGPYWKGFDK